MQKILLIYYEPIPSGQTAHVLSLAKGLDRARYQVTVVLPLTLQAAVAAFSNLKVRVVPLAMGKTWWEPGSFRALYRLIRQEQFDIVHVHSQEAGLAGRLVSWLAGARRIVYTPQTIDIRRRRLHGVYRLAEVLLSKLTERIISVNAVDRERLIRWGIAADKIVVIPNGIDFNILAGERDPAKARRALGLPEAGPVVMQVGRLAAQKDPLAFVAGAEMVLRRCPDACFVMLGEGPLRAEVEACIRAWDLTGRVLMLGHQPDAARWMSAADVVTLTSRWEGTPYSLMEAMAWKKPVVSTDVNGCRELVVDGKTGFLVRAGDTAAWADRVAQLLSDPAAARQFGEEGYRRVKELYSLEKMIDRLASVYQYLPEAVRHKVIETL